jgi:L-threonylcarbamoyladenylate synthase
MKINLTEAVNKLKNSEIIGIPTETVYGLAAVATDEKAVNKIYEVKNRPRDNPLICHFYDFRQVQKYISNFPDYLPDLVAKFSPGPVSYLVNLQPNSNLKPATSGLDTMIFRIPNHKLCLELLEKIEIPLAAPSANTSGKFSPTNGEMVEIDLGDKIAGILDGGECEIGLESTILDCRENGKITILRPGSIGKIDLEKIATKFNLQIFNHKNNQNTTPGNKYSHYATQTPIFKFFKDEFLKDINLNKEIAILLAKTDLDNFLRNLQEISGLNYNIIFEPEKFVEKNPKNQLEINIYILSLGENETQIARNLYQKLFLLDKLKVDKSYLFPIQKTNSVLNLALQNRFEKILNQ